MAAQELAALPGEAVETLGVDEVTPLPGAAGADQALWRSDFWRDCMAPKVVTFKVAHSCPFFGAVPFAWKHLRRD